MKILFRCICSLLLLNPVLQSCNSAESPSPVAGISVTFAGNDTTAKQSKYYSFYMLIINNKFKSAIHDAHIYEFPDKIMYDGKLHSYKDFQFEKTGIQGSFSAEQHL